MKKLYYVIEKSISSDGETLDGNKSITLYEIIDNRPNQITVIECEVSDNSVKQIQEYLDEKGHGEDNITLVQL